MKRVFVVIDIDHADEANCLFKSIDRQPEDTGDRTFSKANRMSPDGFEPATKMLSGMWAEEVYLAAIQSIASPAMRVYVAETKFIDDELARVCAAEGIVRIAGSHD